MIDLSKGRYWDRPWSLVDGCTPCSPGCDHCWSASIEQRFGERSTLNPYVSALCTITGKFNGDIEIHPERLNIPLKRKKPTVYAIWNDWAHEFVCDDVRLSIIAISRKCPQHVFLALTKRVHTLINFQQYTFLQTLYQNRDIPNALNPYPDNWWNGLTVCNQQEADEKIPIFLQIPGKKFLSVEPMLSEINIEMALEEFQPLNPDLTRKPAPISAIILGGETGPKARPMHPDWVRSVRDQCQAAGVPFFFKGWGEFISAYDAGFRSEEEDRWKRTFGKAWGESLRCWRFEDGTQMVKVGRKAAGRILDGRTRDDLPWVKK